MADMNFTALTFFFAVFAVLLQYKPYGTSYVTNVCSISNPSCHEPRNSRWIICRRRISYYNNSSATFQLQRPLLIGIHPNPGPNDNQDKDSTVSNPGPHVRFNESNQNTCGKPKNNTELSIFYANARSDC